MIIIDSIYGEFDIQDSVIIDLLKSQSLERLKSIHQGGASFLVRKGRGGSRYEHSLGVMLLIRYLGGSLEEQIAGLLHDISHTAFSHVIDQVVNNTEESFHEDQKEYFFKNSDISIILEKYNYDTNNIINESNWKILEQPLPLLCADRLDYTLRDLYNIKAISLVEISQFIKSLFIKDGKIIINHINQALWITKIYTRLVEELFMSPIELFANNHLAKALILAIDNNIISMQDLIIKDDEYILNCLYSAKNQSIINLLNDLTPSLKVFSDKSDYDYKAHSKARILNPLILSGDKITHLSDIYPEITESHNLITEKATNGVYVKKLS